MKAFPNPVKMIECICKIIILAPIAAILFTASYVGFMTFINLLKAG